MIILDTNVVSELMRRPAEPNVIAWLDRQIEDSIWITSITILEVRTGIELLPASRRRTSLSADFDKFLDIDIDNRIVTFDGKAAHATTSLIAERRTEASLAICATA